MSERFKQWRRRTTQAIYDNLQADWGEEFATVAAEWLKPHGAGAREHLASHLRREYERMASDREDEDPDSRLIALLILCGLQHVDWLQAAELTLAHAGKAVQG